MAELSHFGGGVIAGPGARAAVRDEARLIAQHGKAGEWIKIRSSNYKPRSGKSFETHAYSNVRTGEIVEMETKFQ